MSKIVFDEPAWWRQPGWQLAAAALLALVALVIWWAALTPVDHDPIVARTPVAPTVMARSAPAPAAPTPAATPAVAPAPAAPAASSSALAPPPLSRMVAPGVHITPLGLPPGTVPAPDAQSEENLEN